MRSRSKFPPPVKVNLRRDPDLVSLFKANERLSGLIRDSVRRYRMPIPNGAHPAQLMLSFSLMKGYKHHRALLILCREGYGEDASIIARTMFELAMDARYIGRDPMGERSWRWLDYGWVGRWYALQTTEIDPHFEEYREGVESDLAEQAATRQEIEENARRVQAKWGFWTERRDGSWGAPGHWSGLTRKALSKKLGMTSHYDIFYAMTSVQAHSDIMASRSYVTTGEDKVTTISGRPGPGMVARALVAGFGYLDVIATNWAHVLEPPTEFQDGLTEAKAHFRRVMEQRIGAAGVERAERITRDQGDVDPSL